MADLADLLPPDEMFTDFEARVRAIAEVLLTTGIRAVRFANLDEFESLSPEDKRKFVISCHDGYTEGQRLLVEEMVRIQKDTATTTSTRKTARTDRNKDEEIKASIRLEILSFHEQVLRKLADALAWALVGHRRWQIKRFYLGGTPPRLESSNYESLLRAADQIHADNPLAFALISDLTSAIQVGDLLIMNIDDEGARSLAIAEVKEGRVNEEVMEFLDRFMGNPSLEAIDEFHESHGKHGIDQADRMMKQIGRMDTVLHAFKHNEGTDLHSGMPLILPEEETLTETYETELRSMVEQAQADGMAFEVIDEWLAVGVFDPSKVEHVELAFAHKLFHWFYEGDCPDPTGMTRADYAKALNIPFGVHEVGRRVIDTPLARPIFLAPLSPDQIMDVVVGRLRILACIDFNRFVASAHAAGIDLEWSTEKQARREASAKHPPLIVNGRFMTIVQDGITLTLGDGVFAQVLYDFLRPKYALPSLVNGLGDLKERWAKDDEESETEPSSATDADIIRLRSPDLGEPNSAETT